MLIFKTSKVAEMEGSKNKERFSVGDTSIKAEFKFKMFGFSYHLPHLLATNQVNIDIL